MGYWCVNIAIAWRVKIEAGTRRFLASDSAPLG